MLAPRQGCVLLAQCSKLGRQERDREEDTLLLRHFLKVLLRLLGPPVLSVLVDFFGFFGKGYAPLPKIFFLDGDGRGLALGHGV
jgi:hypothetical protein